MVNFAGIVVCKDRATYNAITNKDPNKLYVIEGEDLLKLYHSLGQNTDGAIDQKIVTDALGEKQNALTAGAGIAISNNVISCTIPGFTIEVVQTLPATGEAGKIYLVPASQSASQNVYDEYIWVNNAWEKIGSTQVDLSNYYTKTQTDGLLAQKAGLDTATTSTDGLMSSSDKTKLNNIASGAQVNVLEGVQVNGTDLTITSKKVNVIVPTKTSDITNDSGFLTSHQDISGKQDKSNLVTSIDSGSTNTTYPATATVRDFVNSSIATNTANYISNNGEPFTSVAQLEAYSGTVTNNDYAFVTGIDEHGNTYYDRYKATVSGSTVTWAKEYRLNNSSFTASQWATINSGMTSADKTKIDGFAFTTAYLG